MNTAVFVGNLTKDAELKYGNSGTAIVKFAVAVNDREKKGDEWVDYASFLDCIVFGKRAEAVHKYLTKGQRVGISARIKQERWEKDGTKHYAVRFLVNDIDLLGDKRGQSQNEDVDSTPSDFSDDVPF